MTLGFGSTAIKARCLPSGLLAFCVILVWSCLPAAASDDFIAGYALGVLQHEFNLTDAAIEVRNGLVTVTTKTLATVDQPKVTTALKQIPGVTEVHFREADPATIQPTSDAVQATIPAPASRWLPRGNLFSPLHADPRWAHFGAAYRNFTKGLNLSGVFAAN